MKRDWKRWRILGLTAVVTIPVLAGAQTQQPPIGAGVEQQNGTQGKGGKPGGGGTTIVPVTLGAPTDIGCSSLYPYAVNATDPRLVVGIAGGCGNPSNVPFIWAAGSGLSPTGNSAGIGAKSVSDDGVIVGLGPDRSPVEFDQLGNVVENLPLPAGYSSGEAVGTTASGSVVVGWAGNGSSCYPMVWQYASGGWTTGQVIDKSAGFAYGVTKVAGEIRVVGRSGGRAVLWTLASGSLTRLELATDQSSASGINGLGTVVAGTRTRPLARDPSRSYDEHVVWVRNDSGGWDLVPLKGADPSFGEGDASGIADQSDGSTIVVGYSWQNTSGTGGTVWAVAWRRAAGAAAFDSPILLPPLNKKSGAVATDINSRGEVVGVSDVGMTRYAVMWKLR